MSSANEGGARRRVFILFCALVLAAALTVLASGAGAASKCEEVLGTSTFTDLTNDGSGADAPDISGVTVTSYDGSKTSFEISLPGVDEFSSDMLVRTYIDSDKNTATGDASGYEYMIQTTPAANAGVSARGLIKAESTKCENQPVSALFAWDGSAWAAQDTNTLSSWYGDNSLTVELNASESGKALTFNFAVYAASNVSYSESGPPDLSSASFDRAPDSGAYTYKPFESNAYDDPAGDGSGDGAPDITAVAVTKWNDKLLKFSISVPGTEEFGEDMLARILVDFDSNAATGDANGYDYMIQAQRVAYEGAGLTSGLTLGAKGVLHALCYQPNVTVLKWDGSSWNAVDAGSIDWWYSKGLTLSLDPSVIGSPTTFNFAVYAAANITFDSSGRPDLTKEPAYDRAPDTGSYSFPLAVASADLTGVYKVEYRITKSHNFGDLKRGTVTTKAWSFQKRCTKKKCNTKATVKGLGQYKLSRAGKTLYKSRAGRKFACNGSATASGTEKFSMKVEKSGWVKGTWRVTKWLGTLSVTSANNHVPQCGGASSYTASLTGTLKK